MNTHNTTTGAASAAHNPPHNNFGLDGYLVHLKNHGGTKFAVAEIRAIKRPKSDLELFNPVAASDGVFVCAFRGDSFDLMNPEWVTADEFERNWIGD